MGKQIKVLAVKSVWYGKIIDTPTGKMDLHKLYPAGSVLMIDEDDFTDADKFIPGSRAYGAYRRIQDAAPEVQAAPTSMAALKAEIKPELPKAAAPAGRK